MDLLLNLKNEYEKNMKIICVIADGYPYGDSNHCVFVRDLVVEMADLGRKCVVIAPQIIGFNQNLPYKWIDKTKNGEEINVYFPRYYSFSSKPGFMTLTMHNHKKAVTDVLDKEKIKPDVMYGHFIYLSGLSAISIAKKYGIKSFIACGENSNRLLTGSKPYWTGLKFHNWKKKLQFVNGVISVSSENKNLLINNGFFDRNTPMSVIPNAVNTNVFKPYDKYKIRKELGLKKDDFIVVFVGAFIERKGPQRVDEAIKECEGIKSIFIGKGNFTPHSDCIYCGSVKHESIPYYLNAADVFVLPTTGEGCCNAILEAICCGLPIISSNGNYNDDILDDEYSFRVNPLSVNEIKKAILNLYNDRDLCNQMSIMARRKAANFSLKNRAESILSFLDSVYSR